MLTYFSVKNFRCFCQWTKFDLTSDKKYAFNENAVHGNNIKHAMLYGGNGEGKSNLGLAITEITTHLNSRKSKFINLNENYLNADSSSPTADFKYQFNFDGIKIEYHYGKTDVASVVYEKLWIDEQLVIDWHKDTPEATINLDGAEPLDKNISSNVVSALLYVKNNANLTDTPINKTFIALFSFVEKMVYIKTMNKASEYVGSIPEEFTGIIEQIIQSRGVETFETFLNQLGIKCKLEVFDNLDRQQLVYVYKNRKIEFGKASSSGTFALAILYCWLERMDDGAVSFAYIDEFDAFYHQKLAKTIVKKISNINCQTIVSTHNTGIMSNDLLRPDCYFELKSEHITPLYQLSDRELRKAHNLEKMYRAGVFDEQ